MFLDSLRKWVVEFGVKIDCTDSLLKIINNHLPSVQGVPRTHKTLMKTPKNCPVPVVLSSGQYCHYGIQNFMLTVTDPQVLQREEIFIDIGIDGAPLAESSSLQGWPIMGYIISSHVPVFDIGIFVGNKKPLSSCELLREYAKEKLELESNGVLVSTQRILKKFRVRLISADSPARAYLAGTHYHNHTNGCSKCDQPAISVCRRRVFSTFVGNLRTAESFRSRADPDHHSVLYKDEIVTGRGEPNIVLPIYSILEETGHNMVDMFPIDPMHLFDQGVGKIVLIALVNKGITCGPSTADVILALKSSFSKYSHYTRSEFARRSRALEEIPRFKANEVRQFLLYTGVVLLKEYLTEEAYVHFLKLSIAYRLLSSENNDCNINVALELIIEFVQDFDVYYFKEFLRYNVHMLLHVVDDVRLHGPLPS